jgi:hypothetical protein
VEGVAALNLRLSSRLGTNGAGAPAAVMNAITDALAP